MFSEFYFIASIVVQNRTISDRNTPLTDRKEVLTGEVLHSDMDQSENNSKSVSTDWIWSSVCPCRHVKKNYGLPCQVSLCVGGTY